MNELPKREAILAELIIDESLRSLRWTCPDCDTEQRISVADLMNPHKTTCSCGRRVGLFWSPKDMPGIEIPNSQIAGNALQYRTAADLLFRHMKDVNCVLPLLTCASFAIELYLKSLNAFSVYHLDDESDLGEEGQEFALEPSCDGDDEIEDSDVYRVTASPVGHGHKLEDLFNSINAPIRQQMEDKYRSETHTEFVDDLKPYNRTFVDARYCFEKSGGNLLGYGSISQIVRLSAFVSDFVICLLRKGT